MRQNRTVIASSREARVGLCCGWAIRGSFRRGFGWPPFYSQTTQHSSRTHLPRLHLDEHALGCVAAVEEVDDSVYPLICALLAGFATRLVRAERLGPDEREAPPAARPIGRRTACSSAGLRSWSPKSRASRRCVPVAGIQ